MVGTRLVVLGLFISAAFGCGAGDNRIDPGDLELRDLLGVSPEVASAWDAAQRASARRVLAASLRDEAAAPATVELEPGAATDDRIVRALATLDARRFAAGDAALGIVRVELGVTSGSIAARPAPTATDALDKPAIPRAVELQLSDRWDAWPGLPGRGLGLLAAVAADAGHAKGAVVVVPASRLPVIAAYGDGHLVVNPVLLAALEPDPTEVAITTERIATPARLAGKPSTSNGTGNPYSFFGSVAECAAAQRSRCEACLPNSTCTPITTASDGNAECTMLAASDGRGYYLECINLALAISNVDECTAKEAPGCPQNKHAADSLTDLESNVMFLDTALCSMGLDTCLAQIYGTPSQTYPPLVDGGTSPATEPPRSTTVSCGDSCSNKNENCTASPSCDCSGPSCNNSLSCDSGCSNSNHQGSCDSCSSGSGASGGGCTSCDNGSSSSGGGCTSCNNSSSSSGCSGCGSGGCGNSSNSCGSSGKCSVTQPDSPSFALAASVMWAFMPVPLAAVLKRRSRKRKQAAAEPEVTP